MNSKRWVRGLLVGALATGACREMPAPADTAGNDATDTRAQETGTPDVPLTDTPGIDAVDAPGDAPQPEGGGGDGGTSVTIRQIQDLADPMHPAPGSRLSLRQAGLVALTPRVLVGSSRPSNGQCRWVAWIGDGTGGDFSAIQVQEIVSLGDAGTCFNNARRNIPIDLAPGDQITAIEGVTYSEYCLGGGGASSCTMHNFEQAQLFGPSVFTRAAMGAAPSATVVGVSDIAQTATNAPGPRTLALEGALLRVNNPLVRAVVMMTDGGSSFTTVDLFDPADTGMTRPLGVLIENIGAMETSCLRSYFVSRNGMTVSSVTGILVPDYGQWTLRVRDIADVAGASCGTDGGTPDAGMDAATGD